MQPDKRLTKKFKQFKTRVLAESIVDSTNTIYGLSKEHIEVILGIPLPLLMESLDRVTRKKILREQFFYEQFMEDTQGASPPKGFIGGAAHTAKELFNKVKKIPENLESFKDFMSVVMSQPEYLKVFQIFLLQKFEAIKSSYNNAIVPLKEKLSEMVEESWFKQGEVPSDEEVDADDSSNSKIKIKLAQTILNGINQIDGFIKKFNEATGWVKASLGIALAGVLGWISSKYQVIVHVATTIGKGAYIGSPAGASGAVGGAATTVATDLVLEGLKKLTLFFGSSVMSALQSAVTGGITTAIKAIAAVVGGFNSLIGILGPIFDKVVTAYNASETKLTSDQPIKQTANESISLSDLLFRSVYLEQKINKSEKFARKVKSDLYPILLNQAKFILYSMRNGKKPSDKDVLNQLNYYMKSYSDQNPLQSLDTYGVSMLLGYLIKDKVLAGKSKRYYKAVLDAWLKNRN